MYNLSNRTDKIKYIVIHDTGNTSRGADAKAHINYFSGGNRNSSADYFVDKNGYKQFNPDINKYYSWHSGDGKGKYGITNNNSIGIEICVNSDGDYNKSLSNAIDLSLMLMRKYNIDLDHVVRHYDASRKDCPYRLNHGIDGTNWNEWKAELKKRLNPPAQAKLLYRVIVDGKQIGAYSVYANVLKAVQSLKDFRKVEITYS